MSKTAVITAGSKGIGAATAKIFAAAGYSVAISYLHDSNEASKVINKCHEQGVQAIAVQADSSQQSGIQKFADEVEKNFGKIDVLVNNFGVAEEPDFDTVSQERVVEVFNNVLIPTILTTRIFVPKLMQETASVINVASIYGLDQGGKISMPLYSAGKAGVINFTQTMAQKHAPNIRFNSVAPGFTITPHWQGISEEYRQVCLETTLEKEFVQPEDIAKAVLFLAETPHVNAETLVVDAGRSKK